ncbi:hypothetical protein FC18_GL001723 [Lacticaseibacillus sharpeae JCM 1186 = DSM 20505]|uniref:Nudix hydrolase domain-containing protein n=1 Tax=Lacticaseibacillus sharpeae JCM 1186 = DSM 20505 TaxID=1291052 RepID=A0A0R1ZJ85_9LACO|nr:hypothetical protein FC18_GL001723 [Lacticaseibacillus sharpeae JCM 1186 = DSM 20505]
MIRCQDDLLVLAKNDSEFEPSLTFPGGHVEANESVTAGAVQKAKLNAVVQAVLDTYLNGSTRELYFA